MMGYCGKGDILCPLFEHITIDAEAVVAGKGHEISILPRAITQGYALFDGLRLLFQPLCLKRCHPGMYHQARQVRNHLITGRITVGFLQFIVVIPDMIGYIELHLTDKLTIGIHHFGIEHPSHMQYHIVVSLILVVPMQIPIARLVVNLNITHPQRLSNPYLRIEEIRTSIVVV